MPIYRSSLRNYQGPCATRALYGHLSHSFIVTSASRIGKRFETDFQSPGLANLVTLQLLPREFLRVTTRYMVQRRSHEKSRIKQLGTAMHRLKQTAVSETDVPMTRAETNRTDVPGNLRNAPKRAGFRPQMW